jgi:hypothetical protein
MLNTPDLILKDIEDQYSRENFFRLKKFFESVSFFKGNFKHFEFNFDRALTSQKMAHGLGFKPQDVIQTFITGPGAITWDYINFDDKNLVLSTTGACKVRAFIGAYREDL